jgi:ubiquinone/menaquinone biosynthesis C-methylase UbiE
MESKKVKEQYNSMSFFYDVLNASFDLDKFANDFINEHKDLLDSLPKNAKILDSSSGKGIQAVALKKEGYDVTATDISLEMVKLTKQYLKDNELSIPVKRLAWNELPTEFDDVFDLVFCWGNSISHSMSKEEMLENLSSFYKITKNGGKVVIHTRNWEKRLRENKRYETLPLREYNNKKYLPVYIWDLSDFNKKSSVEILFIEIKKDESTTFNSFKLDFVPFSYNDLIKRLKKTGFKIHYDNYYSNNNFYYVVAEK